MIIVHCVVFFLYKRVTIVSISINNKHTCTTIKQQLFVRLTRYQCTIDEHRRQDGSLKHTKKEKFNCIFSGFLLESINRIDNLQQNISNRQRLKTLSSIRYCVLNACLSLHRLVSFVEEKKKKEPSNTLFFSVNN